MQVASWTRVSGLALLVVLRFASGCGPSDDRAEVDVTVEERRDHCGNGTCQRNQDEDCTTCPEDCGACPPPHCGNGTCQRKKGETCTTCPEDCGVCPPPHCGNGTCQPNKDEDCDTCPEDCGTCGPPRCGNGACQPHKGENCTTCPADCGTCPPPPPTCGDDACDASEDCTTCPADCGTCPPPPPSCGDDACDASEDCATCPADCGTCPPPPSAALRVYRVLPPDVTPARALAIAAAIGLHGDVVETTDSVQVVRTAVTPVGPVTLRGNGGFVRLGRLFGFAPVGAPLFTGAIAEDGTLTGALALPNLTATVGTRTITATMVTTAPVTGIVVPGAGRVELTFTPRLTVTCAGTGCFVGACTIDGPTVTVTSTSSDGTAYDPLTGTAAVAAPGVLPAVTACDVADPAAVGLLLQVPTSSGFYNLGVDADPVITAARLQVLTMVRASGVVRFGDVDALGQTATTGLPTDLGALAIAAAVLQNAGLLPPDAELEVVRDQHVDAAGVATDFAVRVQAEPHLSIGDDADGEPILVHVESAHVSITLGADGRVVALHSEWRPAVLDRTVPRIPEAEALDDLAAELGDPALFELGFVYFANSESEPQAFYDPLYVLTTAGAYGPIPVAASPATRFSPKLAALSPEPEVAVDGAGGVTLAATITEGTPPYTITWRTRDGLLGTGATLVAPLAAGDQDITIEVRDASGAGWQQTYRLPIAGAATGAPGGPPPPPPSTPITGPETMIAATGVTYDADVRPGGVPGTNRAGPLISDMSFGTDVFFEKIYFDQWRYEVRVEGPGGRYWLRSDRCSDGALGLGGGSGMANVCTNPQGPFATTLQLTPPVNNTGNGVTSTIQIDNVPGHVTLDFDYAARTAYCGPAPAFYERWGIALAYRPLRKKVGGQCAGFTPEMRWSYEPPESVSCQDLLQWCTTYDGRSNDDGAPYCDVPLTLLGQCDQEEPPTFYVVEFNAWMYSAAIPHRAGASQRLALVKDSDSPFQLAATDGVMGLGPVTIPGNSFAVIHAMRTERTVSVATATGRGLFDNVHIKLDRKHDVFFPGGNDPTNLLDNEPTVHLHESWFEGATDSKGQAVDYLLMRDKPAEREPNLRPDLGVDGESLWTPRSPIDGFGQDTMLFHKSFAQSHVCEANGAVDNTGKPCRVFPSTFFFTH